MHILAERGQMSNRITTSDINSVSKVARAVGFFSPSADQKQLKVMFWKRWKMGPVRSTDEITAAAITQVTDSSIVERWWKDAEFKAWFKNENSYDEDAETNAHLALETMRELMCSSNESVRLKAASESIKLKNELDRAAAAREAEEKVMDAESLQKLLNQAVAAGIVKLPQGGSDGNS